MKKYIVQYKRNGGVADFVLIKKAKNDFDLEMQLKHEWENAPEESKKELDGFEYVSLKGFIKSGLLLGTWIGIETLKNVKEDCEENE